VGRIGKRVIRTLRGGFPNVTILANDVQQDRAFGLDERIRWTEKNEIYSGADIITLHLPLTQDTRHLIAERELISMKSTTVIINTSRGAIVDETALASALTSGRLAGAAVDVFEQEPYAGPLTTIENCILTCHMGSMAEDCRSAMELEAIEDVLRFTRGEPLKQPVPESEYLEMRR
jgi:D-3-phosphoglycerate dehydrogenase